MESLKITDIVEDDEHEDRNGKSATWGKFGSSSVFLRRGWDLGKKAAVTGAALTTVPIVLPPLVVVSALGFMATVPFGFYLATLACTEKVMQSLLPLPTTPLRFDEEEEYDEDNDEIKEKEEGFLFSSSPEIENGLEVEKDDEQIEKDKEKDAAETVEVEELMEKTSALDQETGEESKPEDEGTDTEKELGPNETVEEKKIEEIGEGVNIVEETRMSEAEIPVTGIEQGAQDFQGSDVDVKKEDKEEEKGEDAGREIGIEGSSPSFDSESYTRNSPAEQAETGERRNGEVVCSEREIWEQIRALRTIVGYKAAPSSSYMDEIAALYIFIGAEPPDSSKSDDLLAASNKLKFLKFVIGVQ